MSSKLDLDLEAIVNQRKPAGRRDRGRDWRSSRRYLGDCRVIQEQ